MGSGWRAKKGSLQTPILVIKGTVEEGKRFERRTFWAEGRTWQTKERNSSLELPEYMVQGSLLVENKIEIKLNKHNETLGPHSVLTVTYHKPCNPKRRSRMQRWMMAP